MIGLNIGNRFTAITSTEDIADIIEKLNKKLSFRSAGYRHSPAWQSGKWDGRTRLLRFSKRDGYHYPSGMNHVVCNFLEKNGVPFCVQDNKKRNHPPEKYSWNKNIVLRDYQDEAVKCVLDNNGCGVLKISIRGGKTKTAAKIIQRLQCRTLFIVTSQLLLYQAIESLSESLCEEVGIIGAGEWSPRRVTVATIQTLSLCKAKKDERYRAILSDYDLVIMDESHHASAATWKGVLLELDAPHKIGLSATVFFDDEKEKSRGILWLQAACGRIVYELGMSELIQKGFLLAPEVRLYRIAEPDLSREPWSQELLSAAIYLNPVRNQQISVVARNLVNSGHLVLIATNRTSQIDALQEIFAQQNVANEAIVGEDSKKKRSEMIEKFVNRSPGILISTLLGEGVDISDIDVVIIASGGSDKKATIQRLRNLTPGKKNKKAIVVDFIDLTNKYLASHSKDRLSVYRSEPLFNIRIMD